MTVETWSNKAEGGVHLQVIGDTVCQWIGRKASSALRTGRVGCFKISEIDGWMRNSSGAAKPAAVL